MKNTNGSAIEITIERETADSMTVEHRTSFLNYTTERGKRRAMNNLISRLTTQVLGATSVEVKLIGPEFSGF